MPDSKEQDKPLVSVHLLTYNHVAFIAQSIESVVKQKTDFKFEIIIGDDCSTDGTTAIVKAYEAQYPDLIKVVTGKSNMGPQPNSIRILENCSGKYMAALEGDDYWIDEYKLQKQTDFLEANPDFAMCFTNTKIEFFDGTTAPYLLNEGIEKDVFTLDDMIGEKEIWFMGTATLFYRMSAVFPTQPWFPKTKSGDIPMIILAARHGKIKYLSDVTAAYRKHAAGASNTDHKNDAVFLQNRIMMYTNLNKDTDYKFNARFKTNLSGWYLLLLNSRQYEGHYYKKLPVLFKYISLTFPNVPGLMQLLKNHLLPHSLLLLSQKVRRALGLIN